MRDAKIIQSSETDEVSLYFFDKKVLIKKNYYICGELCQKVRLMIVTYYCAVAMMIIAYLLGSIPSAVWIGRRYYGIDIREHGSKNAGTTNMLRVLGHRAALPVFAIDFIKGFVAVAIVSLLKYDHNITVPWVINLKILATVFVVLGHIFPAFANFKGGKGVATLVGAVTGINPTIMLLCFGVWFIVFMVSHYVSLASMIAGCCFPIFVGIFSHSAYHRIGDISWTFIGFSVLVAILLLWTHRKNIERLKNGTESKIRLWKPRKEADDKQTDNNN